MTLLWLALESGLGLSGIQRSQVANNVTRHPSPVPVGMII